MWFCYSRPSSVAVMTLLISSSERRQGEEGTMEGRRGDGERRKGEGGSGGIGMGRREGNRIEETGEEGEEE